MTSPPSAPESESTRWAATVEELRESRREERVADDADEETTAAELRRVFASAVSEPADPEPSTG